MSPGAWLGVDIGTSSSKGVLIAEDGAVLAVARREHRIDRPEPTFAEMDAQIWWEEFVELAEELTSAQDITVRGIGVSGMGPCVLLTDERGAPVRPAILYGIDTRATEQIERLTERLGGPAALLRRCGSVLTSQAAGPKLAWIAEREPALWQQARHLFMPASWLAYQLTGEIVLDHHSASQCTPLYDIEHNRWDLAAAAIVAPGLSLPGLVDPDQVVGVTKQAVAGIPVGTPVVAGTIDAWAEAASVGAVRPGDLMLMYGTTMFLIATVDRPISSPSMWGTVGVDPATRCLAGGMATSGAITSWIRDLTGADSYEELLAAAGSSGVGARGLLMLPYFSGERTPLQDPLARGVLAGLTVRHGRGDLYRAALEATAMGVRHNLEVMRDAGARVDRIVAVGGGVEGRLWAQIVSDVCGIVQLIPTVTVGAAFGAAYLVARAMDPHCAEIETWNPPTALIKPDQTAHTQYAELYSLYGELYPATREIVHSLARSQPNT